MSAVIENLFYSGSSKGGQVEGHASLKLNIFLEIIHAFK
jgi:hypothetical protein